MTTVPPHPIYYCKQGVRAEALIIRKMIPLLPMQVRDAIIQILRTAAECFLCDAVWDVVI